MNNEQAMQASFITVIDMEKKRLVCMQLLFWVIFYSFPTKVRLCVQTKKKVILQMYITPLCTV